MILQQAFVHRSELFDVERSVVHAPGRSKGGFAIVSEMPERVEEVAVSNRAGIKIQRRKEFAVERRRAKKSRELFIGKHLPQYPEAAPDVVMLGVGASPVEKPP